MKTKAVRVNADYESVLFHNRPQPKINQAIEFLALFLEEGPLLSYVNYESEYLDYVSRVFGKERLILSKGNALNWWGPLSNIEKEKLLNSKITSTEFAKKSGWAQETYILKSDSDIPQLDNPMIAKDPFDMSGRGFRLFPSGISFENIGIIAEDKILILEPLRDRRHDFSHYVFNTGKIICYENIVDQRFQYKGTVFKDWKNPIEDNLSFYRQIESWKWKESREKIDSIKNYYTSIAGDDFQDGFSIDSFTYSHSGELNLQIMCEVNYRRTMGLVAYELSQRYAENKPWTFFWLLPATERLLEKLGPSEDWIVLSPERSRFSMLFLMAIDEVRGKEIIEKVKDLLSLGELSISI